MITRRMLVSLVQTGIVAAGMGGGARAAATAAGDIAAIAEEAFIYGFPMIMNYAVISEYFINTASPQYKAPFNQLYNDGPRLHAAGHHRRHAEQRHAVFVHRHGPQG